MYLWEKIFKYEIHFIPVERCDRKNEKTKLLSFLKDERAQAIFEYILLLGLVIIQAILIGAFYIKIVRNAGETAIKQVNTYTNKTNHELNKWLHFALEADNKENATAALNKTF